MSFRSRTRTTQPIVPRRRSLSNSRVPTSTPIGSSNYSYYNGNPSYTSRPLSGGYYSPQTPAYQSPYTNMYGSRENLYNHSTRNGYYPNGKNNTRNSQSTSNYKNKSLGSYDMRYGSNVYGSDRYISPYSSYDHGVTTAGLSLSVPGKGYSHKNSSYTSIPNNSIKHDYTPPRNSNLLKTKSLSTSNTNVNSYPSTKVSVGTNTQTALVPRSQSLRDQERKSRTRSRNRSVAAATRSLSASSEKSEGYESGSEKASRSRLGSTSSLADGEQSDNKKDTSENGEVIDYKALWEAVKLENDKLKQMLKKKDDELVNTKATVEKFTSATTKNSLSELEKRERRAMERKLSEMEEELKLLQKLKTENERLRAENRALTRVVSKLTTSAQNQLHNKQ